MTHLAGLSIDARPAAALTSPSMSLPSPDVRSIRLSLRVLGLAVVALAAAGAGRTASAGPTAVLVERAGPVESTAPARRAARIAPRLRRAARWVPPSAPSIDRALRRSPVVRRAVPPRRAKSPTYVVNRALLR